MILFRFAPGVTQWQNLERHSVDQRLGESCVVYGLFFSWLGNLKIHQPKHFMARRSHQSTLGIWDTPVLWMTQWDCGNVEFWVCISAFGRLAAFRILRWLRGWILRMDYDNWEDRSALCLTLIGTSFKNQAEKVTNVSCKIKLTNWQRVPSKIKVPKWRRTPAITLIGNLSYQNETWYLGRWDLGSQYFGGW